MTSTRIRIAMHVLAASLCLSTVPATADSTPATVALLDCTVIDDNAAYTDADSRRADAARAATMSERLRARVAERGLYRVADNRAAADVIDRYRSKQDLSACNGCEREIARALGAQRVGVCWVQKVSNLILNLNVRIEDTASGQVVSQQSVDMRGNTDQSWQRSIDALVERLAAAPDASR